MTTPYRSKPGGFQNKVLPKWVLPYFSHVCGRIIWPSKPILFMITPHSNPPRHSSSVPLSLAVVMLCSRINIQRLETQATWRRRRVIVFGLARSISRYFAIFREKQSFPTREERSSKGTRPKGGLPFKRQTTFSSFRYIRKRCGHKQGPDHGSNLIFKIFKRCGQKVWS